MSVEPEQEATVASAVPVDRLVPGDHACLTFSDPDERLDILAAFVSDGIGQNEKVICYTDSVGADELAAELRRRDVPLSRDGLQPGGLSVVRSDRAWAASGAPNAAEMIDHLADELTLAQSEGYAGLRVTADACWAARPMAGAEQLLAYESEVGRLFADGKLTAICQYDRDVFDPVTLGFAARVHPRTVAATVYHEDAVLRICRQHVPPGIRVAGELDYTRAEALSRALAEAVRLDRDVHLNVNRLSFLDAGAASMILRVAADLPAPRRMVVTCQPPIDRTLTVAGALDVPALRMLVRDVER
jgi:anti-anti-sigma regulatory factor